MERVEVMLDNMSFDGGSRLVDGVKELLVANGWWPWWHATDKRPEYKLLLASEFDYRVAKGSASQCWFTTFATHTAGIYRRVINLPIGVELVFGAQVQCWSRLKAGDPRTSDGRYRMRIGIDPYGGIDAESNDIVWCEAIQPYDAFSPLEIRTKTKSDRASIWMWGQAEWPGTNNDAYVDDCGLFYLREDQVPEPPEPPAGDVTRALLLQAIEAAAQVLRGE